jgi:hypothetical protein
MRFDGIARIALVTCFALGMSACSVSCANGTVFPKHWDSTSDVEALYAEELLDHTVKIEADFDIDARFFPGTHNPFPDGGLKKGGWVGSGFVTDVQRKGSDVYSLVMTAEHVCHIPDQVQSPFGSFEVTGKKLTVLTITGEKLFAKVLYADHDVDVCVISIVGLAGTPVRIAHELPPVGAIIHHAGAPVGTYGRHLGIVNDGRYAGLEDVTLGEEDGEKNVQRFAVITNNGNGGSSGGGVYYKGRLFGVLVRSTSSGHPTWCVNLENVTIALMKGRIAWAKQST